MKIAKKLLQIYFLILLLTKCAFLKIIFGIDTYQLDAHYMDVLFNDNLSASDRFHLANRMGAALVQLNIDNTVDEMGKMVKGMDRSLQNASAFLLRLIKSQLEQWKGKLVDTGHQFSRINLCFLWRIALVVDNAQNALKLTNLPVMKFHDNDLCEQIEALMEQSDGASNNQNEQLTKRAEEFRDYFSGTHFYVLYHMLLNAHGENEKRFKMAQWMGESQLDGETKFAHALRALNLNGQLERIEEIKRRMVTFNLLSHVDLQRLELMHPIRMAAGFVDEPTMRAYYEQMFCNNSDITEQFLEYAVVCRRIFAYFLHQNARKTSSGSSSRGSRLGEEMGVWTMFIQASGQILLVHPPDGDGKSAKIVKRGDNVGAMHAIWFLLKDGEDIYERLRQKGDNSVGQMPKALLENLAKMFMNFYEQNVAFRQCVNEQPERRQKFKEMLRIANYEVGGGAVPAEFWHLLEKINDESSSHSKRQAEEAERQQKKGDFPLIIQIKDICPAKKISLEEIKQNEQNCAAHDSFSYTLMREYVELLLLKKPPTDINAKIEPKTIILYYVERVEELFRRSIGGQFTADPNFTGQLHRHIEKWMPMLYQWHTSSAGDSEEMNWAQMMCQCYQFVHSMVKDKQLMAASADWANMLNANVTEWGPDSGCSETDESPLVMKIVLLSESNTQWHQIDCANQRSADALVAEFRKCNPLAEIFHLYSLLNLLTEFDEMRSIFCHETAEKVVQMKYRIETMTSKTVMDRLEMLFPAVLRFDMMTNSQLMSMLFKLFTYKSGTEEAQLAEARASTPFLINEILAFEKKLLNNTQKLLKNSPLTREIMLDKIWTIKRTFFGKLPMALSDQRVLREALCPPLFLYIWLKSISVGRTKIQRADELSKWQPSQCGTEQGVKRAIEENRLLFKMRLCDFFTQNPTDFHAFLQALFQVVGAKTRFLKLLDSNASATILPDLSDIFLLDALWADEMVADEVFGSDLFLSSHYNAFLTTFDPFQWLGYKLKLDLFIFVRWTNAKLSSITISNGPSLAARRCAKFWARSKTLLFQLYDRWFDERMDEMVELQLFQLNLLTELDLYVDKCCLMSAANKKVKGDKLMEEELRKIVQKSQKMYEEGKEGMRDEVGLGEKHLRMELQLEALRTDTIKAMAQQNDQIKEALRQTYERLLAHDELPTFFGTSTIVSIWEAIAEEHFGELAGKLNEKFGVTIPPPMEETETNSKKKKAKRKKNKNGKERKATEEQQQQQEGEGEEEGGSEEAKNTVETTVVEETGEEGQGDKKDKKEEEAQMPAPSTSANSPAEHGDDNDGTSNTRTSSAASGTMMTMASTIISSAAENGLPSSPLSSYSTAASLVRSNSSNSSSFSSCDGPSSSSVIVPKKDGGEGWKCGGTGGAATKFAPVGTKLNAFYDDQFLAKKYDQFVNAFIRNEGSEPPNGDNDGIVQLIKALNVGAFVNEISHRLAAIEWMGGHLWKNVQKKRTFLWWKSISEMDVNNAAHIIGQLYELLSEIWREMDQIGPNSDKIYTKNGSDQQKGIELFRKQINTRKFGLAIVEGKIKHWHQMSDHQMTMALLCLFWAAKNTSNTENILNEFRRNLELLEKAVAQRELDQKIWERYKSNANLAPFIEMKDKSNFNERNCRLFPTEKWQEFINSTKEIEMKVKESEKIKKELKLDTDSREIGKSVMVQLKNIFNEWSDEVQFQFPTIYFLRNAIDKFEPVCILPDGFAQELIFGNAAECDPTNREQCADTSLHCTLCKTPNVTFVQRQPKSDDDDGHSLIPTLKLCLQNVHVEVKFVEIPQFEQIPRMTFSAAQTAVFLVKFGQNIHQLENSDHFDEGVYWHENGKRKELRKAYENDADLVKNFDKITSLIDQSRAEALRQRKLVKERKAMLSVLAANAMHLKLLQFLLPKSDYLSVLSNHELDENGFGMETMDKFVTIFAYLERWAQNNQIFSNELGYLNDEMLLIMLTKLFVLFPDSSTAFLIDKFFLIYSKWKWPMPVQLMHIDAKRIGEFLSWAPGRDWLGRRKTVWENLPKKLRTEMMRDKRDEKMKSIRMAMAIGVVTPTFPERNTGENVNPSSAKVVQNELRRASNKIRGNRGEQQGTIIEPIRTIKFTEKYEHFIVIFCNGANFNVGNFCAFVGRRLRYELYEFVEKPLAIWVNFCHVFPSAITPIAPTVAECSKTMKTIVDEKTNVKMAAPLCSRLWLVGIEMTPNQKANKAFKGKLKANLQKKFDEKIKSDFENGLFYNVRLKSEIAERNDLPNWGIDPNL